MRKNELQKQLRRYKDLTLFRLRNEEAIINAIPYGLDVARVRPPNRMDASENGHIETEAEDYAEALGLMDRFPRLAPVSLTCVEMTRTPGHKTTSFVPTCRIPMRHFADEGAIAYPIYPIVMHLTPSDTLTRPKVMFEWYAELSTGLVVSVRVAVKQHPIVWKLQGQFNKGRTVWGDSRTEEWTWVGAPQSDGVRVTSSSHHERPFVALWWAEDKELRGDHHPVQMLANAFRVAEQEGQ
jgi:hypothetical protein